MKSPVEKAIELGRKEVPLPSNVLAEIITPWGVTIIKKYAVAYPVLSNNPEAKLSNEECLRKYSMDLIRHNNYAAKIVKSKMGRKKMERNTRKRLHD